MPSYIELAREINQMWVNCLPEYVDLHECPSNEQVAAAIEKYLAIEEKS